MAGTLVQLHAEEMAGIVFTQLINPGAPVLYGGIPGMADMYDLSYKAGGVEFGSMNAAISQLATYIDVPNYCSAGITEAKIPSIQAIYEKTFSICQCALAGSNYIHHAAGVLESILTIGYGQFVIDNEIIGMAMKMIAGIEVDADRLAIDLIREVGPGGNFFSTKHTRKYLRDEYLEPMLMPRDARISLETVQGNQQLQMLAYARKRATEIIEGHETLAIPPAIDKEIRKRYSILC
jgi:trimethylamine--corrinoid protein Co-methyltransferase